ncbi:MAG: hypothetical protein M0Z51_11575 [Propionibacterium sp.]|nr:hypothetical protein [Propionibacterium sp.]
MLFWLPLYRIGEFPLSMAGALAVKHGWRPRIGLRAGAGAAVSNW